jgi:hypothetical protein
MHTDEISAVPSEAIGFVVIVKTRRHVSGDADVDWTKAILVICIHVTLRDDVDGSKLQECLSDWIRRERIRISRKALKGDC